MPQASIDGTMGTDERTLPRVGLLGRQPYSVMITESGSGVSRTGGILVNRWRTDLATDAYGQWCYLMNVASGEVWSSGIQPLGVAPALHEAAVSSSGARFSRIDGAFETTTEVVALIDLRGESRRVSISNRSGIDALIELTSYQEVTLAPAAADRGHRAFGNLFVQTEWVSEHASLLAMRRPRSSRMQPLWCGHSVAFDADIPGSVSFETDRACFIGRGRSTRNAVAMDNPGELRGSAGAVLDPVFALRVRLPISAGQTVAAVFSTFIADDRAQALDCARRFSRLSNVEGAFGHDISGPDDALAEVGLSADWDDRIARATPYLIYGTGRRSTGTRENLLEVGLTGEWPIALCRIGDEADIEFAGELVKLHRYWMLKGVQLDMVILCATNTMADAVRQTILPDPDSAEGAPAIVVRVPTTLYPRDLAVLESVARIRLACNGGEVRVSHD